VICPSAFLPVAVPVSLPAGAGAFPGSAAGSSTFSSTSLKTARAIIGESVAELRGRANRAVETEQDGGESVPARPGPESASLLVFADLIREALSTEDVSAAVHPQVAAAHPEQRAAAPTEWTLIESTKPGTIVSPRTIWSSSPPDAMIGRPTTTPKETAGLARSGSSGPGPGTGKLSPAPEQRPDASALQAEWTVPLPYFDPGLPALSSALETPVAAVTRQPHPANNAAGIKPSADPDRAGATGSTLPAPPEPSPKHLSFSPIQDLFTMAADSSIASFQSAGPGTATNRSTPLPVYSPASDLAAVQRAEKPVTTPPPLPAGSGSDVPGDIASVSRPGQEMRRLPEEVTAPEQPLQPGSRASGNPLETPGASAFRAPSRQQVSANPVAAGEPEPQTVLKPGPRVSENPLETPRASVSDGAMRQQAFPGPPAAHEPTNAASAPAPLPRPALADYAEPEVSLPTAPPRCEAPPLKLSPAPQYPATRPGATGDVRSADPVSLPASSRAAKSDRAREIASIPPPPGSEARLNPAGPGMSARQPENPVIPLETTVSPQPSKAPPPDAIRSGEPQQAQVRAESAGHTAGPEAALTVVIRTGPEPSAATHDGTDRRPDGVLPRSEGSGSTVEVGLSTRSRDEPSLAWQDVRGQVPVSGTHAAVFPQAVEPRVEGASDPGDAVAHADRSEPPMAVSAGAGEAQPEPERAASSTIPPLTALPVAATGTERAKIATTRFAAGPETASVRNPAPQSASLQDLQVKAEPEKTTGDTPARNEAQRPLLPPPEPPAPDRNAPTAVRSLALEFTPDGARDVRVRLSQRAGEVHVSLHSPDPAITKSLRAGADDLTSLLSNAGFDARTCTSGRQNHDQQQPRDEPAPQRRRTASSAGEAENFDGLLQHGTLQPNQEIP